MHHNTTAREAILQVLLPGRNGFAFPGILLSITVRVLQRSTSSSCTLLVSCPFLLLLLFGPRLCIPANAREQMCQHRSTGQHRAGDSVNFVIILQMRPIQGISCMLSNWISTLLKGQGHCHKYAEHYEGDGKANSYYVRVSISVGTAWRSLSSRVLLSASLPWRSSERCQPRYSI